MKWDCGPTASERDAANKARFTEWHPHFCIWPRRVGPRDCRWLETIERRCTYWPNRAHGFAWEYRAP